MLGEVPTRDLEHDEFSFNAAISACEPVQNREQCDSGGIILSGKWEVGLAMRWDMYARWLEPSLVSQCATASTCRRDKW